MFPLFINAGDYQSTVILSLYCEKELWAWREARQYFVAYRDTANAGRKPANVPHISNVWRYLSQCYDALKSAYAMAMRNREGVAT